MFIELVMTFVEGFLSFISPCLLPMLPIYYSYLAGDRRKSRAVINSIGFVFGFTTAFTALAIIAIFLGIAISSRSKGVINTFLLYNNFIWTSLYGSNIN